LIEQVAITQAFYCDCEERMLRIAEIVQGGVPLDSVQLDRLHQEFDTLFGGARAVHLPELEYHFRQMARYARHLRNQQASGRPVGQQSWQMLLAGIGIAPCRDGDLSGDAGQRDSNRALFGQRIENIIDNGEAV
jgi:hypothetical protein